MQADRNRELENLEESKKDQGQQQIEKSAKRVRFDLNFFSSQKQEIIIKKGKSAKSHTAGDANYKIFVSAMANCNFEKLENLIESIPEEVRNRKISEMLERCNYRALNCFFTRVYSLDIRGKLNKEKYVDYLRIFFGVNEGCVSCAENYLLNTTLYTEKTEDILRKLLIEFKEIDREQIQKLDLLNFRSL